MIGRREFRVEYRVPRVEPGLLGGGEVVPGMRRMSIVLDMRAQDDD